MSDPQAVWSEASQSVSLMAPFYQEAMTRLVQEAGSPAGWFNLNYVRAVEPDSFDAEQAQRFTPYNHPLQTRERIERLAELDLLTELDDGRYRLTEDGRALIEGFFEVAHDGLSELRPLPEDDLVQLRQLLERIVQATLSAPNPVDKPALNTSRWTDPGAGGSEAARIDQYITDLYRYRDDAHVAAWQAYNIDGAAWEALTLVWQEEAATAGELLDARPNRGFTVKDYADALESLADRGWLQKDGTGYQLTAEGRQVREEAEAETDRLFYGGWSTLSADELDQLGSLVTRMNDNVRSAALAQLWELMGETSQAIYEVTRPVIVPAFNEQLENPAAYTYAKMILGREPARLLPGDPLRRFPYVNPVQVEERLAQAAEDGLLSGSLSEGYTVTERGRSTVADLDQLFYEYLTSQEPIPADELNELAGLFQRLVQGSLAAPEPADRWAIQTSHRSHPSRTYGPLAHIDQHLDDLNAFRDDAHNAAWRPLSVSGRTWETLTLVWRDQANSAAHLAEQLAHRGYSAEDYDQSLAELAERGWLQMTDDGLRLTPAGLATREAAETTTDRLFFTPWQSLQEAEMARLRQLIIRLKLALQKQAEEQQSRATVS